MIEDEIEELERNPDSSAVQKARLTELKSELEHVNKKKEEYVQAHPEHRNLVDASARRREQRERETVTVSRPLCIGGRGAPYPAGDWLCEARWKRLLGCLFGGASTTRFVCG